VARYREYQKKQEDAAKAAGNGSTDGEGDAAQ
jgi:hypothetical protein